MTQIIAEIPTLGLVSMLGSAGQESAIFAAILDPQDRIAFFAAPTIMSNDARIAAIANETYFTVNELIAPFGGNEDV